MAKKPELNVTLLKRIIKHLREEPKRYNQGQWAKQVDPTDENAPVCGVQGCIAGWAVFLSIPNELWAPLFEGNAFSASGYDYSGVSLVCSPATKAAQKLLGLTDDEAAGLFQSINQSHSRGEAGVREATAKINLLIRDRAEFVERYK